MSYSVGYKSSDFFYSNAPQSVLEKCNDLSNMQRCDILPGNQEGDDTCINIELCKNFDYATALKNTKNSHLKSEENYVDADANYKYQLLNLLNLGTGIIFSIWYIYYNR